MRILTTCLSKCEEVLEQSAEVFAEVKESSLLQEICEVEEGRNKLRGREGGELEGKEVKRGLVVHNTEFCFYLNCSHIHLVYSTAHTQ